MQLDPAPPARLDHRVLGREMELFAQFEEIGAGLPVWLPRGAAIRSALEALCVELEHRAGYQRVASPPLARESVYARSGHLAHYADDMFPAMELDGGDPLRLRPMNCPHHILVYAARLRSHRELPVRISEMGQMFRAERSGSLEGLSRVRCICLNDAHIFARPEDVEAEISACIEMIREAWALLGVAPSAWRLSLRGPGEKYVADDALWDRAESQLRGALLAAGVEFVEAAGEAAFYGPKLDVQVRDVHGREESLASIQLDFHLPERFDLSYVGPGGDRQRPVMIHRSVCSSLERMCAHLLEAHQGALPPWCAPVQLWVACVRPEQASYAREVAAAARDLGIFVELADPQHSLGSQLREGALLRAPWIAVVGPREEAARHVSLRLRGGRQRSAAPLDGVLAGVRDVIRSRSLAPR